MTIGQKMMQTLATIEGAAANIKTFALDTQDKTAQQMFYDLAEQLTSVSDSLRGRVNYIEQQEPQYSLQQQQEQ